MIFSVLKAMGIMVLFVLFVLFIMAVVLNGGVAETWDDIRRYLKNRRRR